MKPFRTREACGLRVGAGGGAAVPPGDIRCRDGVATNLMYAARRAWKLCPEAFGYVGGGEWLVAHYRFARRS